MAGFYPGRIKFESRFCQGHVKEKLDVINEEKGAEKMFKEDAEEIGRMMEEMSIRKTSVETNDYNSEDRDDSSTNEKTVFPLTFNNITKYTGTDDHK